MPDLNKIHHIAFAVHDLEATIKRYESLLGIKVSDRGFVASRGAEVAIFKLENMNLEFVTPVNKEGSLQKYLDEKGEGFFHLAFGVEDVEESYHDLINKGVAMEGPPKINFKDWKIAYLDPKETAFMKAHIIDQDAK